MPVTSNDGVQGGSGGEGKSDSAGGIPGTVGGSAVRRRGRRPAGADTRGAIVAAARHEFAERGYARASVRSVARRAGVDPALVRHYFHDKGELFAAGLLPAQVDPALMVERLAAQGREDLGRRLLAEVLRLWEADDGVAVRTMFSGLASGDIPRERMEDYLGRPETVRAAGLLDGDDADLRVAVVAAHVLGVLLARDVLRVEPLASLPPEQVVEVVGPVLQGYLTRPLLS